MTGDEVYELRFRDLDPARTSPRRCRAATTAARGARTRGTSSTPSTTTAYRPYQVWRHTLGTPVADDVLVLEEPDERFELCVRATRSGGLVVLWAESRDTREVWVVDADDPDGPAALGRRPAPRRGVPRRAPACCPTARTQLLVVTNDGATEFRLARCPVPARRRPGPHGLVADPGRGPRRAARAGRRVRRPRRAAPAARTGTGCCGCCRSTTSTAPGSTSTPAFPTGTLALGAQRGLRRRGRRPSSTSPTSSRRSGPTSTCAPASAPSGTGRRHRATTRRRTSASGGASRRPTARAVPVDAASATATPRSTAPRPALLYGYGAYEAVDGPEWDPALPSLLDRGVVFVHAHVRGGGEGGRRWWLRRPARAQAAHVHDHVAVADGLAGDGRAARSTAPGSRPAGSRAGGLLQGAVFSQRPDRWRAVVAEVPFVDVVTTMFDASIPLTVTEWDEWGDPHRREEFDWMLAYSPYDNLPPAGGRPDLLVTGALHDPRVMVWEPAKWVAALRDSDPAWSPRCLFRVRARGRRAHRPGRAVRPPGLRGRGLRLGAGADGARRRSGPARLSPILTHESARSSPDDPYDAVPPTAERAQRPGPLHALAGHLSALRYTHAPKHEYFAVRNSVGVFDTSPLFKYRITGPDAERLLAGVLARDIRSCRPGPGALHAVVRRPRLRHGGRRRLPARRRRLPADGRAALPGLVPRPRRAGCGSSWRTSPTTTASSPSRARARRRSSAGSRPRPSTLGFFDHTPAKVADTEVTLSRTGYTGDLGYEVTVPSDRAVDVLDAILAAGEGHGMRPFGEEALMMLRIEAGLPLIDVEWHNSRTAFTDADRVTPKELGLGWMLRGVRDGGRAFVGGEAIRRELLDGTSRWASVGIVVDWQEWDRLHRDAGVFPAKSEHPLPYESMLYDADGEQQVGYATSFMYCPVLQRHIGLARVRPDLAPTKDRPAPAYASRSRCQHHTTTVAATTTRAAHFDPPRKTAKQEATAHEHLEHLRRDRRRRRPQRPDQRGLPRQGRAAHPRARAPRRRRRCRHHRGAASPASRSPRSRTR